MLIHYTIVMFTGDLGTEFMLILWFLTVMS